MELFNHSWQFQSIIPEFLSGENENKMRMNCMYSCMESRLILKLLEGLIIDCI